jgi:aryl-alcohol dehydrogenase-like predicted oxidoreductase
MRFVEAGGVRVSAVGLGTWQFGSREWGYGDDYAQREAGAIVERAIALGVTLFDTAEIYGFGRSERILGEAIAGRRDQVFVATKILPLVPVPPVVRNRVAGSLRRLQLHCIDLYQVHWPNPVIGDGPMFRTLAALQAEGRIAQVGVSNYSLDRWKSADDELGSAVLSNQVEYSLAKRAPEKEILPWAQANGRIVIAYSPLAQGFLSGRYDAVHRPGGARAGNPLFLPENLDRGADLLGALREIAGAHHATPSQVALAWLLRRPNVVVIPGASSVAQLESNVAAADLELSESDDARLTAASDQFHPKSLPAALPDLVRARLGR